MHPSGLEAETIEALRRQAQTAAEHAYAPYSHFYVGAALLLTNGETATGCNVENASYGLTICAERAALVQAVARYGPEVRLRAVCIVNRNQTASPPCGACRQVLAEFALAGTDVATWVFFPGAHGEEAHPLGALLPFGFSLLQS
jgi:cytidine deaminase